MTAGRIRVRVRDRSAEAPWGSGPTSPVIRTVEISATCPRCGGPRGEPRNLNQVDDGAHYSVDVWANPCGHADPYTAVVEEARQLAAAVTRRNRVLARYRSNSARCEVRGVARSIDGDADTAVRDEVLTLWGPDRPALVFGTWKRPRPAGTHTRLIWDTLGALGMGDLSVPWKPSDQEIYVIGYGFAGRRTSNVLSYPPVQSTARNGRIHPHEKPVDLLRDLVRKCPPGVIADPFAGSGSLAVAARLEGRRAVVVELREEYCELIARRLAEGDHAVKRADLGGQLSWT